MLQKLQNLAAFSSACQALRAGKSPLLLDGLAAIHKAHFAAALCRVLGRGAVLLTDEEAAATRLMEDINRFYGEERALLYPEREFTYHSVESVSREYEQLRLGVLRRLQRDPSLIVVGTVAAALQPTLLPEQLSAATLSLRVGQEYPPQKLLEFLVQAGYQRAEQVEGIGQFAARGGIVDFYPPQYSWPIRLEYWGDEVDSIAAFSLESQRREDSMKLVEITPVRELLYQLKEEGYEADAPYNGSIWIAAEGRVACAEVGNTQKIIKTKSAETVRTSAAYDRLANMGQRLLEVIRHNQGGANKDLAKFASQIAALCDKWDR